MERINRDTRVATVLLVLCGIFFWASFDIRVPDYGALSPSTWPRTILVALTILSLVYLFQSIHKGPDNPDDHNGAPKGGGFKGWLIYWQNPIYCFALFLAYLAAMPILGMLMSGILFVFILQCMLGGWQLDRLLPHAGVAVLTVGGMWSIFTYGLDVMLPRGIF